jgi:hypothetical protein
MLTPGGVRYLMANGDPAQAEQAKTALRSAAIGYGLAIPAPPARSGPAARRAGAGPPSSRSPSPSSPSWP